MFKKIKFFIKKIFSTKSIKKTQVNKSKITKKIDKLKKITNDDSQETNKAIHELLKIHKLTSEERKYLMSIYNNSNKEEQEIILKRIIKQLSSDYNRKDNSPGGSSSSPLSDQILKMNIISISHSIDIISSLHGVKFEWKNSEYKSMNFDDKAHIGFIAQEVEEVLPELVYVNNEGFKCIEYANLVAVLVESTKEQQKLIIQLNERITNLESTMPVGMD